ncbi:GyrI-like domain-containing protein [Flavobacterium sp. LS1R47]|jgi:predicted transcriptional regulator YdeE|uniref:GyrI-like domain-containing protein n=1 Tax=Flavobacterium frigoritolerans TaxID=2987686 RepID=A0A9X2ZPM6_9FLAO|nr:GyrI-like domain-containing protein [Flavobacterium frigoritolerans]MCV9933330.1 GyrI-like domain-containing protein [Flavobacterium frigoritolerans]
MELITIEEFFIIGLSIRTTNENNQSATDIPALWNKFMTENTIENIPNKIDNSVYSVYTEYEKDYTKPYTTILGCKVSNLDNIPAGMIGKTIAKETYKQFTAKGNLADGIVIQKWIEIWNTDLNRKYTADFEIYGEKASNPESAEVPIFIAI